MREGKRTGTGAVASRPDPAQPRGLHFHLTVRNKLSSDAEITERRRSGDSRAKQGSHTVSFHSARFMWVGLQLEASSDTCNPVAAAAEELHSEKGLSLCGTRAHIARRCPARTVLDALWPSGPNLFAPGGAQRGGGSRLLPQPFYRESIAGRQAISNGNRIPHHPYYPHYIHNTPPSSCGWIADWCKRGGCWGGMETEVGWCELVTDSPRAPSPPCSPGPKNEDKHLETL
ncbi:unnamed protein product [Pleuronectes platessa]|uniref:Uncharacterized protein n=1 Tax=Pleuronectes platessa TaxID=8262 RepID=A0A9N7VH52_PLEPL|nr:unnamed protein product [Pleuronectes platessa]